MKSPFLTIVGAAVLLLTGAAMAQDVRFSARAFGTGAFEAFVDGRSVPKTYALSPPKLLVSCFSADNVERQIWVDFHPHALESGRLVSKILPLPGDCIAWNGLLNAQTSFGVGKADEKSADIFINQGAIGGNALDLSSPLPRPNLRAPANGSVFYHFPRTTNYAWDPVPGAFSYSLEIQIETGKPAAPWERWRVYQNIRANSFQADFVGMQSGLWRVWAISKTGQPGYASAWWKFTYNH